MKKSYYGVYYNTKDSEEFYFVYEDLKFYFSSEVNLRRFKEKLSSYLYEENVKINNKYSIKIDLTLYLMFSLYKIVEKRGYKIIKIGNNEDITNDELSNIKFISYIES